MRVSWIDCTLLEVRQRQYQSEERLTLLSDKNKICDKKIDFLKNKNQEVKDRRDRIDTKARTLLTLTSLLLGLISSATSITSAKSIGLLSVLPLVLLFSTIFLLTVYFGVDRSQTTNYDYVFVDSESADRDLCNDMISSQDYNERAMDFMLDLYRAALRYFSLAMLLIMLFGIGNIIFTESSLTNNKDQIKSYFAHRIFIIKQSLCIADFSVKVSNTYPDLEISI